MTMRLHPLSQSYGHDTVRRYPRTLAEAFPQDHADAIEHHPSPRSWLWNDAVIALVAVGVLAWLLLLGGGGGGGDATAEERDATIGPVDWAAQQLPQSSARDQYGGWTLVADQRWWGHKALKRTRFYIVGCHPNDVPAIPLSLGRAEYVIGDVGRASAGNDRPEISKSEREHTPPELARWLVALADKCRKTTP